MGRVRVVRRGAVLVEQEPDLMGAKDQGMNLDWRDER